MYNLLNMIMLLGSFPVMDKLKTDSKLKIKFLYLMLSDLKQRRRKRVKKTIFEMIVKRYRIRFTNIYATDNIKQRTYHTSCSNPVLKDRKHNK